MFVLIYQEERIWILLEIYTKGIHLFTLQNVFSDTTGEEQGYNNHSFLLAYVSANSSVVISSKTTNGRDLLSSSDLSQPDTLVMGNCHIILQDLRAPITTFCHHHPHGNGRVPGQLLPFLPTLPCKVTR